MTPIHEQEWKKRGPSNPGVVDIDAGSGRQIRIYAPMVELEALDAAVEELPRLLMMLKNIHARATFPVRNGNNHLSESELETIGAALRKAGVI